MHITRVYERLPRLEIQFRISRSFRPQNPANLGSKSPKVTDPLCDYSNRGTWQKIILSQRFLQTTVCQFFLQTDR